MLTCTGELSRNRRVGVELGRGRKLADVRRVEINERSVVVECSAAVSVIIQGRGTGAKAVHGASMTRAEVPRDRLNDSPWLRVTVVDKAGKRAWSNPYWT